MNDILNKTIVLVLNRNWQAIHVRTPQEAFCMRKAEASRTKPACARSSNRARRRNYRPRPYPQHDRME